MTMSGWILILAFFAVLLALTKPMGLWLHALYEGRRTPLHTVLGPIERGFYRLSGIDPAEEQSWKRYAVHMLVFNAVLALFTYAILRLQAVLPLNAGGLAAVPQHLAANTAVSFTTNTNWQSLRRRDPRCQNRSPRCRRASPSHNFFSARRPASALAIALIRGIARREAHVKGVATLGNFWVGLLVRDARCTSCFPSAPSTRSFSSRQGVLHKRSSGAVDLADARRRDADVGAIGPVASPGGDQDARHERRRLLQRQQRPSRSRTRAPLVNFVQMISIFADRLRG